MGKPGKPTKNRISGKDCCKVKSNKGRQSSFGFKNKDLTDDHGEGVFYGLAQVPVAL